MAEAVIVSIARSPIGRAFKGSLRDVRPDDLAAQMVARCLEAVPELDPAEVDDLLLGCGMPGGEQGFNMARVVAVLLGYDGMPGATVTRYCASSIQTTRMAMHSIRAREANVVISAGVEAISRSRKGTSDSIPGADLENPRFEEARVRSQSSAMSTDTWSDPRDAGETPDVYIAMGQTAENVASLHSVSRREQDDYAVLSQNRAEEAARAGFWLREITPVHLPDGTTVAVDDSPRAGVTIEAVSALTPAFRPGGTVTAGNCCPLSDGAAAMVLMSDEHARNLGITPLARVVSTAVSALSPEIMGLGPVEASRRALAIAGLSINDVDLVEMNEAFAAQVIPSARALGVDFDRLNVHGGAIAVGHPFGMTGARMTATLINGLQSRDGEIGLATLCVGGGQGMALVVERLS